MAHAEVVDGNPEAHPLKASQFGTGGGGVEHRLLGDFDFEARRVDAGQFDHVPQHPGERIGRQFRRRHVDGDADVGKPHGRQFVHELGRGKGHVPRQRLGGMGRARGPNDFRRRHRAENRMRPADQRLEPGHRSGAERDLRLEENLDIVLRDRLPDIDFELPLAVELALHFRVEDADATPAPVLGGVKGDVGAGKEFVRQAGVIREERKPDAGAAGDLAAIDDHRLIETGYECGRKGTASRVGVRPLRDDGELVPSEADHEIAPGRGPQPPRQFHQHSVARRMPHRVVDRLEAVEVDDHQRDRAAVPMIALQDVGEAEIEGGTVAEAGQRIAAREDFELLVRRADLGIGLRQRTGERHRLQPVAVTGNEVLLAHAAAAEHHHHQQEDVDRHHEGDERAVHQKRGDGRKHLRRSEDDRDAGIGGTLDDRAGADAGNDEDYVGVGAITLDRKTEEGGDRPETAAEKRRKAEEAQGEFRMSRRAIIAVDQHGAQDPDEVQSAHGRKPVQQ